MLPLINGIFSIKPLITKVIFDSVVRFKFCSNYVRINVPLHNLVRPHVPQYFLNAKFMICFTELLDETSIHIHTLILS